MLYPGLLQDKKDLKDLENHDFTRDLVRFYISNNIIPVIETDFSSSEKLDFVYSFFRK